MDTLVEHKQLQRKGYVIHYFAAGQPGKRLIIFLHPAFADHRAFDHQLDYFAARYRVITVDLLGHGLSCFNGDHDKIDASADHLRAIMDAEGYQRVRLVGVSMGSLIAQYVALRYPERVASLTVVGGYDINANNPEIQKAQRGEAFKWMLRGLLSMNSFRRYVASVSVLRPEEQAKFYDMAQGFQFRSFMALQGLGKVIQKRTGVQRSYPLLLMCGDHDLELAQQQAHAWHTADPEAELCLIENAGHCANMDQPAAFNTTLAAFLARFVGEEPALQ